MEIFRFGEHEIRAIIIAGVPWFVGHDVAKALGYSKPNDTIRTIIKEKHRKVCGDLPQPFGLHPNIIVISEPGLFKLAMKSTLPSAEDFQDWVYEEVLPQIRKTGGFTPLTQTSPREYIPLWDRATREAISQAGIFPGKAYQGAYIQQNVYEAMTRNLVKKPGILDKKPRWYLNNRLVYLHQLYSDLGIEENKILQGKIIAAGEIYGYRTQKYNEYLSTIIGPLVNKAITS